MYVVLELCEGRVETLIEHQEPENVTLAEVIQASFQEKSMKTFGMGLLVWMQLKAAKLMGNKLGIKYSIHCLKSY
jgi:pheromone shutdown protein TraB